MNEYYLIVNFKKKKIITDLEELVQNDYEAYKLKFEFDKEFERALFKLKYPTDNKIWVQEINNNELILPVLESPGIYKYEISIYSENGRLTDYAIKDFNVRSELVNTDDVVETDDRVPILDNLINETNQLVRETTELKEDVTEAIEETNNLDINVNKTGKEATIELTKKDNTVKTETLFDGTSLMFHWDGTKLGIKTDEDEEYTYVDLLGRTGSTPNIQIGTVTSGDTSSVTITGTSENPVLNFVLEKGETGATGPKGDPGETPDMSNYYNKTEIDSIVGDISSVIDTINGEVI